MSSEMRMEEGGFGPKSIHWGGRDRPRIEEMREFPAGPPCCWLRPSTYTAWGVGWIPGWGTNNPNASRRKKKKIEEMRFVTSRLLLKVDASWKRKRRKMNSLSYVWFLQPHGLPGSSLHGILQARVLEWVAISFSRGSSWPRYRIWVSCIAGWLFTIWATREKTNS